jgi:hypothetical protein
VKLSESGPGQHRCTIHAEGHLTLSRCHSRFIHKRPLWHQEGVRHNSRGTILAPCHASQGHVCIIMETHRPGCRGRSRTPPTAHRRSPPAPPPAPSTCIPQTHHSHQPTDQPSNGLGTACCVFPPSPTPIPPRPMGRVRPHYDNRNQAHHHHYHHHHHHHHSRRPLSLSTSSATSSSLGGPPPPHRPASDLTRSSSSLSCPPTTHAPQSDRLSTRQIEQSSSSAHHRMDTSDAGRAPASHANRFTFCSRSATCCSMLRTCPSSASPSASSPSSAARPWANSCCKDPTEITCHKSQHRR